MNTCYTYDIIILSGGKGSHVKLEKAGERPITIPHGEINKYTERGIKKQAGLL
ncbi:TPA: type II toxin-antitoxin system HicA family toxin [Streptococcus equi subsp. zooepidemicus]|nr:type II toxin-antitoxin system HicA family toxin [Streptococcus equi subsp. zooepidemicus]